MFITFVTNLSYTVFLTTSLFTTMLTFTTLLHYLLHFETQRNGIWVEANFYYTYAKSLGVLRVKRKFSQSYWKWDLHFREWELAQSEQERYWSNVNVAHDDIFFIATLTKLHSWISQHKKWSFSLRTFLVNVNKSVVFCGFAHIH